MGDKLFSIFEGIGTQGLIFIIVAVISVSGLAIEVRARPGTEQVRNISKSICRERCAGLSQMTALQENIKNLNHTLQEIKNDNKDMYKLVHEMVADVSYIKKIIVEGE